MENGKENSNTDFETKNNSSGEKLPYNLHIDSEKRIYSPFRQLGYVLRALVGDYKYALRRVYKEFRAMFHFLDLIFVALGFIIVISFLYIGLDFVIPELLGALISQGLRTDYEDLMKGTTTIRLLAGLIGAGGVVIRLIMKPPVLKFIRKSKINKDVTYVFGSTPYAEKLLKEMVWHYAYEDKVALISENDLLWVRSVAPWIDTIWVNPISGINSKDEFGKEWFYDKVGFENAKQIFLLTDSVELNQNVLTNIRRLRPDVDIFVLANYAPAFLRSDREIDPHTHVIDDIKAITDALVLSLSLDIKWPNTAEIDVPVTFYKSPASAMTHEADTVEVLGVKRDNQLLPPDTILQRDDRILVWYRRPFDMKRVNRVTQEFLIQPWPPKGAERSETEEETVSETIKKEIVDIKEQAEDTVVEATETIKDTMNEVVSDDGDEQ